LQPRLPACRSSSPKPFRSAGKLSGDPADSTRPGDILDDAVSANRGMAIKLLGVPCLADATGGDQDSLMLNGPVFGS
jgi:hypothetical protein